MDCVYIVFTTDSVDGTDHYDSTWTDKALAERREAYLFENEEDAWIHAVWVDDPAYLPKES